MKHCPACNAEVIVGENLTQSQWDKQSYACRPCRSEAMRKLREANPEHYGGIYRKHRNKWKDNPEWRARRSFYENNRRARILNQTPEDADMDAIEKIYMARPDGYHVDHIKPLSKGGLHHQDNLQHLTAHDNLSKGARYE